MIGVVVRRGAGAARLTVRRAMTTSTSCRLRRLLVPRLPHAPAHTRSFISASNIFRGSMASPEGSSDDGDGGDGISSSDQRKEIVAYEAPFADVLWKIKALSIFSCTTVSVSTSEL